MVRAATADRQYAAAGDSTIAGAAPADGLREVGAAQPDGQHQGPDGAAHPRRSHARRRAPPGDTIVEATSGNTGISFAAIGRAFGIP
jgi:hypothetical protein